MCFVLSVLFFLGDERIRTVLGEATKKDDLVKKSVIPRRNPNKDRTSRGSNAGTSGPSNIRSRSPQDRGRGNGYRKPRGSGGAKYGRGNSGKQYGKSDHREDDDDNDSKSKGRKPKSGEKKKKGECLSPQSFSEAWSNFFTSAAVLLVTSVGLIVENIPALDSLPLGGRLRHCIDGWRRICTNNWVCNVVEFGYKIPLKYIPRQVRIPSNPNTIGPAYDILVAEAQELKAKEAVCVVSHSPGEYISSYFAVPKPRSPGKFRPILNLKRFNKCVKKYRFSMETLKSVRDWIRPGAWCVGLDLKDAFPHIPIHPHSSKYLRFVWLNELLQWIALPFGLTCSPRVITKVLKPIIAFLRATWSILISIYIDDMLIQSESPQQAIFHAQLVMLTLMALGWSFNFKKCNLIPSQTVVHLGFEIDTVAMTISCPKDKIVRLQDKCKLAFIAKQISVHDLERLLGTMESVRPATPLAALHYRSLQRQLLKAKLRVRIPSKIVVLTTKSQFELRWWVAKSGFAANCSSFIREQEATVDIWTDANLIMGGARSSRGNFVQRAWDTSELSESPHINLLELRAARDGVAALASSDDIVRLHLDNRTACAYIRKQGGTKSSVLSREACMLWEDAVIRGITILTPHWLSTKDNVEADFLSRNALSQWEFYLCPDLFMLILETFQVTPTLDAFASRDTAQLPRYMSWFPDRYAVAQDALLHPWDQVTYLFPPVPLLLKVLRLVREQKIRAILVCPQWPTALWWSAVVEMMVEPLLPLPHYRQAVRVVAGGQVQPYMDPLVAVHISGETLA